MSELSILGAAISLVYYSNVVEIAALVASLASKRESLLRRLTSIGGCVIGISALLILQGVLYWIEANSGGVGMSVRVWFAYSLLAILTGIVAVRTLPSWWRILPILLILYGVGILIESAMTVRRLGW